MKDFHELVASLVSAAKAVQFIQNELETILAVE